MDDPQARTAGWSCRRTVFDGVDLAPHRLQRQKLSVEIGAVQLAMSARLSDRAVADLEMLLLAFRCSPSSGRALFLNS